MILDVREPSNEAEFTHYFDLRWRILREPWMQSKDSERDDQEAEATHLGAWLDGVPAGVGRLHFLSPQEAQIRYMAVEQGLSGQGIGSALLSTLEQRTRERGAVRAVLNARETAMRIYSKHGSAVSGPAGVLFDQIPHREKDL